MATETAPGLGVFSYVNGAYFPINGLGHGNEGHGANFHFTIEINTELTYTGGETFSFTGDDESGSSSTASLQSIWVASTDRNRIRFRSTLTPQPSV